MIVTNRVREVREARSETLRAVAEAIGIDAGHLSRIEQHQRPCPDAVKVRLAAHFQTPAPELFPLREVLPQKQQV